MSNLCVCRSQKGFCAPYNGTVCADWLSTGRMVFYNSSLNNPEMDPERIVWDLLDEMIDTFGDMCRVPATQLLCHYAFPDCDTSLGQSQPKPLCRYVK